MIEIMTNLEPIRVFDQDVIFVELEDVQQVIFFLKGFVDMGYEIEKK
jgi:hypothetical protein